MSWKTAEEAIQAAQKAIGPTAPEWDIHAHQMADDNYTFLANRGSWLVKPYNIDLLGILEYRAALAINDRVYSYGTTVRGAMMSAADDADKHLQELLAELRSARKEIP